MKRGKKIKIKFYFMFYNIIDFYKSYIYNSKFATYLKKSLREDLIVKLKVISPNKLLTTITIFN